MLRRQGWTKALVGGKPVVVARGTRNYEYLKKILWDHIYISCVWDHIYILIFEKKTKYVRVSFTNEECNNP